MSAELMRGGLAATHHGWEGNRMAKHRAMSPHSKRARTILGGVVAGGALAMIAPTGLAQATPGVDNAKGQEGGTGPRPVASMADNVGRPDFKNPAPGVRAIQTVGDTVFNQDSDLNAAVDNSALGAQYHRAFGTRGTFSADEKGVVSYADDGSNGYVTGILNTGTGGRNGAQTIPGKVYSQTVVIRECNIKVANQSGVPSGARNCHG
jgi:hypothetical protein